MNNRLLMLSLGVSVTLTGCDSLLYSDNLAPVVSSPNNVPAQVAPPLVNVSTNTGSVEQPNSGAGIIVQQNNDNPYGELPARPDMGQDSVAVVPAQSGQPIQANSTAVENKINDPRIREGSDILEAQGIKPHEVIRPQATAQRPVAAVSQQQIEQPKENRVPERPESVSKSNVNTATIEEKANETVAKASVPVKGSATRALLQEAKAAVNEGEYDKAASALERAHRIEPSNAKILYDIAQIRYAQGKYRQAASFASKATTYSNSPSLSKKVWTLLSNARKQLGNVTGAEAAAQKAASFN